MSIGLDEEEMFRHPLTTHKPWSVRRHITSRGAAEKGGFFNCAVSVYISMQDASLYLERSVTPRACIAVRIF